jgi:hypothetical protein
VKPAVRIGLVGANGCGKTTLARTLLSSDSPQWFDLEDPQVVAQLAEPLVALRDLRGLVVIDEIQHAPDLFKVLRVLIDRPGVPVRFLVLGSASPALLRQSSESLAGRIEVIDRRLHARRLASPASQAARRLSCSFIAPDNLAASSGGEFIRTTVERTAAARHQRRGPMPIGSGRCLRTITASCGTPRSPPACWESTRARCGAISTC